MRICYFIQATPTSCVPVRVSSFIHSEEASQREELRMVSAGATFIIYETKTTSR